MEKSRLQERVQLANQIIGPLRCWRKKVKYLLPVCQILWYFTEGTAKKVTVKYFAFFVFILMSENIEKRSPESDGLF